MDADLEALIATSEGCAQLLFDLRFEEGSYVCPKCSNTKAYKISTRDFLFECANSKCKKQTSLTAGTYFHGKKSPLQTCFRLLLDIMSGREISALEHSRELKVSPSTVWRWRQELRISLHRSFPLGETVKVDRNLLIQVLFRRSVESPAVNTNDLHRQSRFDRNVLHARSPAEGRSIAEANRYVVKTFKGVSEKYSQLYFAEFRFIQRARMYEKKALLGIIVRAGPVSVKDIIAFSSPKFVDLPASKLAS